MRRKNDVLKQELQDIWMLVFGEPPIIEADCALMAQIIKQHLADGQAPSRPETAFGLEPAP